MKTTLPILLSGAFFAVVQTQNARITDTGKQPCPVNEIFTECEQCDSFCNGDLSGCTDTCIGGNFCICDLGYSRISKLNRTCVPDEWCAMCADENCTYRTKTPYTTGTAIPRPDPPKKGEQSCPVNEIRSDCKECDNFCNEEPAACNPICTGGPFCTCEYGYSRFSRKNSTCIPEEWCYLLAV